jgi:formamidase
VTKHSVFVDRAAPLAEHPDQGHNRWHPLIPPMVTIADGDEAEIHTRDGLDNQITFGMDVADLANISLGRGHALTGPVYVEGAEPGDLLAVDVLDVTPHTEAFTSIAPGFGFLRDLFEKPALLHWSIIGGAEGHAVSEQLPGVKIPGAPFFGVMGVAPSLAMLDTITARETALFERGGAVLLPDAHEAVPSDPAIASTALRTIPPRENGGNHDIKQFVKGTTVFLPVYVEGGLFSVGDAHYAQGDGESCGTAVETSAVLNARFRLLKGEATRRGQRDVSYGSTAGGTRAPLDPTTNFYATSGMCIAADGTNYSEDLSLAARNALINMIDYITDTYGYDREQAMMLCSVAVDLRISQVVDVPNLTVSAFLPLDIFE